MMSLGSNVYKLAATTGQAQEHGRINYVNQDWVRGPYLNYISDRPHPGFAISPLGQSYVTYAPQDPNKPFDCPGMQVNRMTSE
jgi:hypothetical protein